MRLAPPFSCGLNRHKGGRSWTTSSGFPPVKVWPKPGRGKDVKIVEQVAEVKGCSPIGAPEIEKAEGSHQDYRQIRLLVRSGRDLGEIRGFLSRKLEIKRT